MGKKANWHKAKHGLIIKAKISFGLQNKKGRAQKKNGWGEKRREEEGKGREEEEKRRRNEEQKGMELCIDLFGYMFVGCGL